MVQPNPERFWDERARENALYFVDNQLDYRNSDAEAFWAGGDEELGRILGGVGLEIGSHETVLDIGCGVGRMTRALAVRAARVLAMDVSGEMLARAREQNSHLTSVDWIHGDGRSLRPVGDAAVDGCFSWVVFQHIPDEETIFDYVREMARVLKPGGWAVFQASTNPAVHHARPGLSQRLRGAVGIGPRGQADPAWVGSSVEVEALRRVLEESGLDLETMLVPNTQFTTVRARRRPGPAR